MSASLVGSEMCIRDRFFLHEMSETYSRKGLGGQKLVAMAFASWLLNSNNLQDWSRSLPSVRFPLYSLLLLVLVRSISH
eukprot:5832307-Alexandrium_andersonii.AAC.1